MFPFPCAFTLYLISLPLKPFVLLSFLLFHFSLPSCLFCLFFINLFLPFLDVDHPAEVQQPHRVELPMPRSVVPSVGKVLRGARVVDFSADQVRLLNFGRVIDIAKLKNEFGYTPRWTTREAFDDYIVGRGLRPVLDGGKLAGLAGKVLVAAATGQSR